MDFKTQLYNHQVKCVEKLKRIKIGALYMEQGTGKTRTALELIKIRLEKERINHVLWLCPCSVKENLRRDIILHTGDEQKDLITICGIESLSSSNRINKELSELVKSKSCYLIIDESSLVKNFFAKRTKNIMELSNNCTYKLILNGTPISRNEIDLFSQWYLLDHRVLGYQSYWSFAANHIEYDENIPGKVRKCLNVDYLAEKIAPYAYQVKKDECLDLPPKTYDTEYFSLTHEQNIHYEEVKDIFLSDVDEFDETTIYRLFNALQLVLSGFRINAEYVEKKVLVYNPANPGFREEKIVRKIETIEKTEFFENAEDNPRLQTLLDIVYRIDTKVIIFCKYTHEINLVIKSLNKIYGDNSAVAFNGDLNLKKRQANLDKFKDESRFLVANKQCGAFGLNLQWCSYIIYYSNDWDYGTRIQSEDRIHRIGQNKNVNIIDICASNKLDERILDCLFKKERLVDSFKKEIDDKKDVLDAFESWITVKTKDRWSRGKYKYKYRQKKVQDLDKSDLIIKE